MRILVVIFMLLFFSNIAYLPNMGAYAKKPAKKIKAQNKKAKVRAASKKKAIKKSKKKSKKKAIKKSKKKIAKKRAAKKAKQIFTEEEVEEIITPVRYKKSVIQQDMPTYSTGSQAAIATRETAYIAPPAPKKAGLSYQLKSGIAGGAFNLGVDLLSRINDESSIILGASYGFGNKYNVIDAALGLMYLFNDNYIVLAGTYDNYSTPVKKITGLPEMIDEGGYAGGGILIGRNIKSYFVQLGFSSSGGALATVGYKF